MKTKTLPPRGLLRGCRGWDDWMASLTPWTWVWGNSRRYWRTGEPGGLQSKGLQRMDMTEPLNNKELLGGTDYYAYKVLRIVPETKNLTACNCYCYPECYNYWKYYHHHHHHHHFITTVIINKIQASVQDIGLAKRFHVRFLHNIFYGKTRADFFVANPILVSQYHLCYIKV